MAGRGLAEDGRDEHTAAMTPPEYWFPAKRYGWGWGFPLTWQGWAVVLSYCAVVLLAAMVGWGIPVVVVATVVVLLVCLNKGEPTSWRWGDR